MKRRVDQDRALPTAPPRRAGDVFVVMAMGIVVLACTTALNLQFGIDLNTAVAIGTVAYAILLGLHALRNRRAEPSIRRDEAPAFEAFDRVHERLAGAREPQRAPIDASLSHLAPPPRGGGRVAQVALPPLVPHSATNRAASPAHLPQAAAAPQPYQPAPVSDLAAGAIAPPAMGAGDLESDVERIQALVKKLADEISAADEVAERAPRIYARAPRSEAAVNASVQALRETASGMRTANTPPRRRAPQLPVADQATPPPLGQTQSQIAAVADSLVAGRVEVELEPILSLVDQRTSHYEVSVNVLAVDGRRLVENGDFAGLHATGLLPLFDSARLNRSVSVVQRLQDKGKKGRVFSAYSSECLTSPSFLSDARSALQERGATATQLVIGLRQSDVRGFSASEWSAIAELRQLHVVFSLDRMTDLDVDLKRLVAAGFAFARVDGTQCITGLRFGGRPVAGGELMRYLTGAGLTVVADNIDSEALLQRLGAAGVQLGQGRVFGGRRAVKVGTNKVAAA
jgi:cyclic-di-GMP phosphodiesterase TipF (flagellum assembly factor)